MANKRMLSVGDFAKMAQVTQATLHHYDKIRLISPVSRGKNHYRYYSIRQLSEINLIRTMRRLGMPLDEIKSLQAQRSPERTAKILEQQLKKIEDRIHSWTDAHKLISALLHPILSVQGVDEQAITIQYLPAEPMVLGDWNKYAEGEEGYDALVRFYDEISMEYPSIDLNYPVWGLFTMESVNAKVDGKTTWPDRYYFYSTDGQAERPAGFYAIGYTRGGYGHNDDLYIRLWNYIKDSDFEISGDSYEEYPLNEICIDDETNYLTRVMIPVRKKENGI